jgi:hypothetical protein
LSGKVPLDRVKSEDPRNGRSWPHCHCFPSLLHLRAQFVVTIPLCRSQTWSGGEPCHDYDGLEFVLTEKKTSWVVRMRIKGISRIVFQLPKNQRSSNCRGV